MQIKQQLIGSSRYKYKSPYTMKPIGITIHNTDNDASAANEVAYMSRNNNYVSFHIAVDDKEAIQAIPFNRNSYHAGDNYGNRNFISIEICYSKSGGSRFDEGEKNGAKVAAQLLKKYNWTTKQMKRHYDHSGKNCPARTMSRGWGRFVNMVEKEMGNKTSGTSKTSTNVWYGIGSPHNNKNEVKKLQQNLVEVGFSVGKYGANGVMGKDTEGAIKAFQKKHGLTQDGQAGKKTLDKLQKEVLNKRKPKPAPPKPTPKNLYRVRKSWGDVKSQNGAYADLNNAIKQADSLNGYNVYNEKGEKVYPKPAPPKPTPKNLYRVRKSWGDVKSQNGAYADLNNAIKQADSLNGYNVYNEKGEKVYPKKVETPKPTPTPPKPEVKPTPKPEVSKIAIEGKAIATAKQMEKLLLSNNPKPAITITPKEFTELFINEGAAERIRGDIAFCQAMKETGWLKYGGQILPEQNNYAGIGATNNSPTGKGAWFKNAQEGIRAQIQHLKAYATNTPLTNDLVDPRFKLVSRGSAQNWTDLNGKWAVPGTGYGEDILVMYQMLLKVVVEDTEKDPDSGTKEHYKTQNELLKSELIKLSEELKHTQGQIEQIKNIIIK